MKSDATKNAIVLPIKGNRYVSIIQNTQDYPYKGLGHTYGDYGDKVEIAILDSDFNYLDDGTFEYGIKPWLTTRELSVELLKLIGD